MRYCLDILFVVLAPIACAQSSSSVQKTLQADYDAMGKAYAKADIKVFDGFLAPGYVLVQPTGGKWDRKKTLSDLKTQMKNMKSPMWKRTIRSVQIKGGIAVVTETGSFKGTFMMQGKPHVFELKSQSTDTWSLKPKQQMLKSEIKQMSPLIDGKKPPMS